ncbi:radical SAM protein [Streptomyces sp. NBC_00059]|uniref:B12-binding domain-containing radical SAM protein n=1 Tax=Streptomyces sp. NBC_00059 TaxID=2975635 RepID=UPI002257CEC8|nr:radical SAM protein [Streptomyces sp. NBC_00059]MCX5415771.1 radical SAM protein [Streptomyces sp. NBC_00059]
MCLYAALSVAVHRAVADAGPLEKASHYTDVAPEWTRFPEKDYRLSAGGDGYRAYGEQPNTDQTVFDPRVWDDTARARWTGLLREVRPRVVLISTVSPGHRYALQLAELAKREVPETFVVFGGRHVDETTVCSPDGGTLLLKPSSPLAVMGEGKTPGVVDAVVSGEAYHAVDLLMRALALAIDLDRRWVDREQVLSCLQGLLAEEGPGPGRAFVALSSDTGIDGLPLHGPALDLGVLPSPYEAFAIRSRFPIFTDPGTGDVLRTAHVMVSNACPYRCNFCSESSRLTPLKRFKDDAVSRAAERICEYVSYGAESLFFDDSVFWTGRYRDIEGFCEELRRLRSTPWEILDQRYGRHLTEPADVERLRSLQWGAQLTVDTVVALHTKEETSAILRKMREAGCTYVYIGIESMSTQVMVNIHKNLRRDTGRTWCEKVRDAVSVVKENGLRVGTSVLFGLDGETRESIDETIQEVGLLIDDGLIDLASPNILTYHPATPVTQAHGMADKLDYHSPRIDNREPYIYFEEAFPGVVSVLLSEDDIWHIHRETERRWGGARNDAAPVPTEDDLHAGT